MKKCNIIQEKSFCFATRIVKLYRFLLKKKEFVLTKQILRSGTSIGANIEEAIGGQSKKDFVAKISIAYKEARETDYWLRLLLATGLINNKEFNSIYLDLDELQKIIVRILKTCKMKK